MGGVSYAGSVIATKGSGQLCFCGIHGPYGKEQLDSMCGRETAKATGANSGMNRSFLGKSETLALPLRNYNISADNITMLLDAETFLLVEVKGNKLSSDGDHWILVTSKNDDGTVNVRPLSPEVSAHDHGPQRLPALQTP